MSQALQCIVDSLRYGFRWREGQEAKLWHRRFYVAQFSAAAVTKVIDVTTFPGGMLVEGGHATLIQNFAGGGASTCVLSAGTTGATTKYINAQNIFTGASAGVVVGILGATQVPGIFLNTSAPSGLGTVRFTVTADVNTNLLTTGIIDIFLRLRACKIDPA